MSDFLIVNPIGGLSGDMLLGALSNLVPKLSSVEGFLNSTLKKILKTHQIVIKKKSAVVFGVRATQLKISHPKTIRIERLNQYRELIDDSQISEDMKDFCLKTVTKLFQAESKVHGVAIGKVHLHEAGDLDTIIDILGISYLLEKLKWPKVYYTTIPISLGDKGLIKPWPAATEILSGMNVRFIKSDFEHTTPTGAAILSVLGNALTNTISVKIRKTTYSTGTNAFDTIPNILQLSLVESIDDASNQKVLLSTNIDDQSPEIVAHCLNLLLERGANDCWIESVIMKKGRPGFVVNVLCDSIRESMMLETLFKETGTLGVRRQTITRHELYRFNKIVDYQGIKINTKHSKYGTKADYDDLKKASKLMGSPVIHLKNAIEGANLDFQD